MSFYDDMLEAIKEDLAEREPGSIVGPSYYQRKHLFGFVMAGQLFDQLEDEGIIERVPGKYLHYKVLLKGTSMAMRTLNVYIETNRVGGDLVVEIELPADSTEDEIRLAAEDAFYEECNFGYGWKDEE